MDITFSNFMLTVVVILLANVHSSFELDTSHMVDPSGWNYDRSTQSTKNRARSPSPSESVNTGKCMKTDNTCKNTIIQVTERKDPLDDTKIKPSASNNLNENGGENIKFIKRLVNILLNAAGLSSKRIIDDGSSSANIDITVTAEELKTLEKFSKAENDVPLRQVDDILSNVIRSKRFNIPEEYYGWMESLSFLFHSKETWFKLGMVGLPVLLIWLVLLGHTVTRIVTLLSVVIFSSSYVITYYRMYKEVEIKQMLTVKANPQMPMGCRPHERSFFQMLTDWLSSAYQFDTNNCQKYHEALLIDPLLEVWPTRVLSAMLTDFVLHPSERLGSAIASFSSGLLRGLPPVYAWIVYLISVVAIFILLLVALIMLCGGRVRISGFLTGIEMSSGSTSRQAGPSAVAPPPSPTYITDGKANHPFIDAVSNSSSSRGLVLMDTTSIKELMSGNFTLMHHREAMENILPSSSTNVNRPDNTTMPATSSSLPLIQQEKADLDVNATSMKSFSVPLIQNKVACMDSSPPRTSVSPNGDGDKTLIDDKDSNEGIFLFSSKPIEAESMQPESSKAHRELVEDISSLPTADVTSSCGSDIPSTEEKLFDKGIDVGNLPLSPVDLCSHGLQICKEIRENAKPRGIYTQVRRRIISSEIPSEIHPSGSDCNEMGDVK